MAEFCYSLRHRPSQDGTGVALADFSIGRTMRARKPSWQHRLVVAVLSTFGLNRRTASDVQRSVHKRDAKWKPTVPPRRALRGVRATSSDRTGWPVWTLEPGNGAAADAPIVVAVHGGGYTLEIISLHWRFYGALVRRTGAKVIVPIYPLAPRGTAATVVPLVADIIAEQVVAYGADRVGVEGDSAGAGLLLAAMQMLVQRGSPVPAHMVLISPWLDATLGDPRSAAIDDPLLSIEGLREAGRLWAGGLDVADPRISPINGSLKGLPPTLVFSSSHDLLYPDTLRLRELARNEDADFDFDLRDDLIHGWAGFSFLPEARQVAARIQEGLVGQR